ncbi:DUF21 domain-containing protein [Verrucomicrobia bacterium S94]|nr:DUF21 domain-containing protein [Verrucomicrobia bacterium S94]
MTSDILTWTGILVLIIQSGVFSGLNLAMFGLSALRLQAMADTGNRKAAGLFALRQDSNFLLTTILWGNVSTNVLLALLSDSVMAGVAGFFFSTVIITLCGEIMPQAYFSRHALQVATLLSPLLKIYQILLYPVARPTAWLLDKWLGKEGINYLPEEELMAVLKQHMKSPESDVGHIEGRGAVNFLALDDLLVTEEGEPIDPRSILALPMKHHRPVFPAYTPDSRDPFLKKIQSSGKRWVVLTDPHGNPAYTLDCASFMSAALFSHQAVDPMEHCHRPVMVYERRTRLSQILGRLETAPGDDNIRQDVILLWSAREKRIITGSDLFGYLMRGIVRQTGSD